MAISIETLAIAKKFAKSYTDDALSGVIGGINYIGAVNYYSDLPNNPQLKDAYTVLYSGTSGTEPDGTQYVWAEYEGTVQWIPYGINRSLLKTYQTFRSNWTTDGTIAQFCADVNADPNTAEGMGYVGELTCSDLPFVGNADAVVEIIDGTGTSDKVIHIILTSGNVYPYRWEYTYWSNGLQVSGWIGTQPEVLTVIYTKTNNTVTCNQEWQTIKDAIDNSRPIQGWYVSSEGHRYEILQITLNYRSTMILASYGDSFSRTTGTVDSHVILDSYSNAVRTISVGTSVKNYLPNPANKNGSVLGVQSDQWDAQALKTINSQSLIGSGDITTSTITMVSWS